MRWRIGTTVSPCMHNLEMIYYNFIHFIFRRAELVNEELYRQHLVEMNKRIARRPLLFERVSPQRKQTTVNTG